jgi:hypothetical protein
MSGLNGRCQIDANDPGPDLEKDSGRSPPLAGTWPLTEFAASMQNVQI